jgi:Zn/Cd-binding protein ZinT
MVENRDLKNIFKSNQVRNRQLTDFST